jgi:SAM-dependent methyltransferase
LLSNDLALDIGSYNMYRCEGCGCEFSDGRDRDLTDFYKLITSQPGYYPRQRWEYKHCSELIRNTNNMSPVKLLDIGCGSGLFLESLSMFANLELSGLDTCQESIDECIIKGISAHNLNLDEKYVDQNRGTYDFVTSFHCLEHVPDPSKYLSFVCDLLKPTGVAFVSTPLSPLLEESVWFDPLNNPPHHLTRFTEKSFCQVARMLDLNISIALSPPRPLLNSLISLYKCKVLTTPNVSAGYAFKSMVLNPFRFFEFTRMIFSKRHGYPNSMRNDVLLASFTKKRQALTHEV